MTLSQYHQKYADKTDEEITKRANVKEQEIASILKKVPLRSNKGPLKLAVLGCGDKRFIAHHKKIFEHLLQKKVEITTFDITTEHLDGEEKIIRHDCTSPLPYAPYDITYGHVLLKFIERKKQFAVLKNSFDALKSHGIAIHILDKEDYETTTPKLSDGLWSVPLKRWEKKLKKIHIEYKKIPIKYGLALVLLRK